MKYVALESRYDAEIAAVCDPAAVCACGYPRAGLEGAPCPECGSRPGAIARGDIGTPAEVAAALRLYGPIRCGHCRHLITESADARCSKCDVPVKLAWFPQIGSRRRGLTEQARRSMMWASAVGGLGLVLHVIPVALVLAWGGGVPALALAGFAAIAWFALLFATRRGWIRSRPWLIAAAPWWWLAWLPLMWA